MNVEIVTPKGAAFAGEADEVTAPGRVGELGLLPGHVPLLAALKAGVLRLKKGGREQLFAVRPGYVQVGAKERVIVLVEECLSPDEIDLAEARKQYDETTKKLAHWDQEIDADWIFLDTQRSWADARVEVKTGEF